MTQDRASASERGLRVHWQPDSTYAVITGMPPTLRAELFENSSIGSALLQRRVAALFLPESNLDEFLHWAYARREFLAHLSSANSARSRPARLIGHFDRLIAALTQPRPAADAAGREDEGDES